LFKDFYFRTVCLKTLKYSVVNKSKKFTFRTIIAKSKTGLSLVGKKLYDRTN